MTPFSIVVHIRTPFSEAGVPPPGFPSGKPPGKTLWRNPRGTGSNGLLSFSDLRLTISSNVLWPTKRGSLANSLLEVTELEREQCLLLYGVKLIPGILVLFL